MWRLKLSIFWANFKEWLYEVTHEKDPTTEDDAWYEQLKYWNAHPESLDESEDDTFYKNGVLVRQTWRGLIKVGE